MCTWAGEPRSAWEVSIGEGLVSNGGALYITACGDGDIFGTTTTGLAMKKPASGRKAMDAQYAAFAKVGMSVAAVGALGIFLVARRSKTEDGDEDFHRI